MRFHKAGTYRGLAINSVSAPNLLATRLDASYWVIANCLQQHRRTVQQHHTLKIPVGFDGKYTDGELISRFFRKLGKAWDTSKRNKLHYVWCKEVEKGKHCHIHIHTFCDDKFNRPKGMTLLINKCWAYALKQSDEDTKGLVHSPNNYQMFHGESLQLISDAMRWVSYLCKIRKGTLNHGFRASQTDKTVKIKILTDQLKE